MEAGGLEAEYTARLGETITLLYQSAERERAEVAAYLLRLMGVEAEVKRVGRRWYVAATTDELAAGREELRDVLAGIVREAKERGYVGAETAERWLEKLEKGVPKPPAGWPKFRIAYRSGGLSIEYATTSEEKLKACAQRLGGLGLEEGVHFATGRRSDGRHFLRITPEGVRRLGRLWARAEDEERRREAETLARYLLERAKAQDADAHRRLNELMSEGRQRGVLSLRGLEKAVGGVSVKVHSAEAWIDGDKLRMRFRAEVGGVESEWVVAYSRDREGTTVGFYYASADVPGGPEADADRYSAFVEAVTGERPTVIRHKDGRIRLKTGRKHLDGFMQYSEVKDAIEKWLGRTRRR